MEQTHLCMQLQLGALEAHPFNLRNGVVFYALLLLDLAVDVILLFVCQRSYVGLESRSCLVVFCQLVFSFGTVGFIERLARSAHFYLGAFRLLRWLLFFLFDLR